MVYEDILNDEISFVVENVSVKNNGIKGKIRPDAESVWFNYGGVDPEGIKNKLVDIRGGDTVVLIMNKDRYVELKHVPNNNPQEEKDEYSTLPQLLAKLKKETEGQFSIETTPLDINMKDGYAVFKAQVRGVFGIAKNDKGENVLNARWATCHGDATQANTTAIIGKHFVRMAESRAIARALRIVLGVGNVSEEEVGK